MVTANGTKVAGYCITITGYHATKRTLSYDSCMQLYNETHGPHKFSQKISAWPMTNVSIANVISKITHELAVIDLTATDLTTCNRDVIRAFVYILSLA